MAKEHVEHGLKRVMESGMEFEPSLPKFIELCEHRRLAGYHEVIPSRRLTGPYNPNSVYVMDLQKRIAEKKRLQEIDANLDHHKVAMLKKLEQASRAKDGD